MPVAMRKGTVLIAVLFTVGCRGSPSAADAGAALNADSGAALNADAGTEPLPANVDWAHVAASVYLAGEDYQESKEVEGQLDARRPALLRLVDGTLASIGPAVSSDADLVQAIRALRGRLAASVDYDLPHDAALLADRVALRAKIPMTPPSTPDLAHGAAVYARACAACHGANADGRPEVAVKLDPPPSDLLHPDRAFRPYDTFARVTYGGLETAMPAFGEGLSVQERWDLVFYLFAARWPKCDREVAPMKASALALFSDFDLSAKLPYDAIGCARQHFAPP